MPGAHRRQGRQRESIDHWGGRLRGTRSLWGGGHPASSGSGNNGHLVCRGGAPPAVSALKECRVVCSAQGVSAHLHAARAWGWLKSPAWVQILALPLTSCAITG